MTRSPPTAGKHYLALPDNLQRLVDCRIAGGTLVECARAGGSQAASDEGLKKTACRWLKQARVQMALEELQAGFHKPGTPEGDLRLKAFETIDAVMSQAKTSPAAAVKAAELALKLSGDLGRKDVRHPHLHLHMGAGGGAPALPPAEQERMLAIALRGRRVCCPSCGAEVELDTAMESGA